MLETAVPNRSVLNETYWFLARAVPRPLRVPLHFATVNFALRGEQAQLSRLSELCPVVGRALDVGANYGLYTFPLVRRAQYVDAFEPQQDCARNLRAFGSRFAKNLNVHDVALSDTSGRTVLKIPSFNGRLGQTSLSGLASIDNDFDRFESVTVPCARIDDFRFTDVSFIKIDVEGHEDRVIAGAAETLVRCRSTVLVEIEQRHLGPKPIEQVFTQLEALGYRGGFYRNEAFVDLDKFDARRDQTAWLDDIDAAIAGERYINMFVFRNDTSISQGTAST